jgi:hypothetical protein
MKRIVEQAASAVVDGSIVLLGGIQINTSPEYSDYSLPKDLNVFDNLGVHLKTLKTTQL